MLAKVLRKGQNVGQSIHQGAGQDPKTKGSINRMQQLSSYNADHDFSYNLLESRLQKCAAIMQSLPVGRLLDIGCARGDWAMRWKSRGWTAVSGVDVNPEQIALARASGVDSYVCDLNREILPFSDAQFDLIFAGEVIEHLVDTDGFLKEVRRCCRPGGNLLLTTPNLASFENRVRLMLGIYPKWLNYNLDGSGHVRLYTPSTLKRQLLAHGFKVVKHIGNWVPFIPQRYVDDIKMPLLAITGDLLPNLAMDIIVLAQRVS